MKIVYSKFKLKELLKQFDLTIQENQDLFANISEVESSKFPKVALWRFLKLEGQIVSIDAIEYYLRDVGKILGIGLSAITSSIAL